MKMRVNGNSLRLRVSRSELSRLMLTGRIEETIQFAPENHARLTYALEHSLEQREMTVRYRPQEVTVVIPREEAQRWSAGDQVGLYCDYRVGDGVLALVVEKDFACLDRKDPDNEDKFPNPNRGAAC